MGSWIGHAGTGSFFVLFGLFLFVRSLEIEKFSALRTRDRLITLPNYLMIAGGITWTIIEYVGVLTTNVSSPMSHLQHFSMCFWFILGGIVQLLHQHRIIRPTALYLIQPLSLIVIGEQFSAHSQPILSLSIRHWQMSMMFVFWALSDIAMFTVSLVFNKLHHISALAPKDPNSTVETQKACACCGLQSKLNTLYTNPVMYTTPLPLLSGFFCLMIGIIDWGMSFTFAQHMYRGKSWEELAEIDKVGMGGMMMDDQTVYGAMNKLIWQLMGTIVFLLIAAYVLRKFDKKCSTNGPSRRSNWRDEVFNWSGHFDGALV